MKVAVVLRGDSSDGAALRWVATQTRDGDDVHVMHPYRELTVSASSWKPAVRAAAVQRDSARRAAVGGAAMMRQLSGRTQFVGHTIVAATQQELLVDLATFADMIVTGVPTLLSAASALAEGRRASRQAGGTAVGCRIALVPEQWQPQRGVVVLADESGSFSRAALNHAIAAAERLDTSVRVMRPYRRDNNALSDIGRVTAQLEQTEALDIDIEECIDNTTRSAHPALVAEIAQQSLVCGLRRLAGHVALLVQDTAADVTDASDESLHMARVALSELQIPVMLVAQRPDKAPPLTSSALGHAIVPARHADPVAVPVAVAAAAGSRRRPAISTSMRERADRHTVRTGTQYGKV